METRTIETVDRNVGVPDAPSTERVQSARTQVTTSSSSTVAAQIVWWIAGVMDAILAFDFIFRAASAANVGFVSFIYAIADPLAAPFDAIFGTSVSRGVYVIRWGDLVAMAVYTLIALAIARLIGILARDRQLV